ncbi:MAG: sigma-70 family RNA polymerase sigma factor [Planctomycetota bacterium]
MTQDPHDEPFHADLGDPDCVQKIYDFVRIQINGLVDYNDEDDVIQEVFYRLTRWPMRAVYESKPHYYSLLKITARQVVAAYWKRWHSQRNDVRRRRFISELESDHGSQVEFVDDRTTSGEQQQLKELVQKVLETVQSLSHRDQVFFKWRFILQRTPDEISEALKISVRTCYRIEARLREKLQKLMQIGRDLS